MTRPTFATALLGLASLVLALAPAGGSVLAGGAGTARAAGAVKAAQAAARSVAVWSPATFVFSGHGWGHGVGLSQYGAYGFAQHGYSYDQIVSHYYPGTTIEDGADATVRVLLASGRANLTISSATAFSVSDAGGVSGELLDFSLDLDTSLIVDLADGQTGVTLTPPVLFTAGASPLTFGGRAYRGAFQLLVVNDKLRLVNHVGLEAYLYGVVPNESPHDWPAPALQAQAVVARSYALASLKPAADFDVYTDTRSQVYRGRAREFPETNEAVDITAGKVVYYGGEIARTFFFSTSGGRTAAIQDVWPKAEPEPYLVSVEDPYDDVSPYHNWGPVTVPSKKLAKKLKISGAIADLVPKYNPSKRVSIATITAASGAKTEATGDQVKEALGLRSSWFSAKVLALQRPKSALPFGTKIRVQGRTRRAAAPILESRPLGGAWSKARDLPKKSGFSLLLRPRTTTYYRIVDREAASSAVRFAVAPRIQLLNASANVIRGKVYPNDPAAAAKLQRRTASGWKVVGNLPLNANGTFRRPGPLRTALYRIRVTGVAGLVPGFSAEIDLR